MLIWMTLDVIVVAPFLLTILMSGGKQRLYVGFPVLGGQVIEGKEGPLQFPWSVEGWLSCPFRNGSTSIPCFWRGRLIAKAMCVFN